MKEQPIDPHHDGYRPESLRIILLRLVEDKDEAGCIIKANAKGDFCSLPEVLVNDYVCFAELAAPREGILRTSLRHEPIKPTLHEFYRRELSARGGGGRAL